jgi:hypothetical protein
MTKTAICAMALLLAGWSAGSRAADAEIVLQNDGPAPVFARATDNNAPTPTTSMQERLDHGVGTTVAATLDDSGNYSLTWTVTDPVDPPTKTQSGDCKGPRDAICYIDFSNPQPMPESAPRPAPTPPPAPKN